MVSSNSPGGASHTNVSTPVPFPQPVDLHDSSNTSKQRTRTPTNVSTTPSRIRTASIKLMEANPPPGMWAATGSVASKAPSLVDIRRGSFGSEGWDEQRQREHRRGSQDKSENPADNKKASSAIAGVDPFPALTEARPSLETRENEAAPNAEGNIYGSYDGTQDAKNAGTGIVEPRTSHLTDKSEDAVVRQPLRSSQQVRCPRHIVPYLFCPAHGRFTPHVNPHLHASKPERCAEVVDCVQSHLVNSNALLDFVLHQTY